MFIGSYLVGSQPFHTWYTFIQWKTRNMRRVFFQHLHGCITIDIIYDANFKIILAFYLRV